MHGQIEMSLSAPVPVDQSAGSDLDRFILRQFRIATLYGGGQAQTHSLLPQEL